MTAVWIKTTHPSKKLIEATEHQSITNDNINSFDLTELLRCASKNLYLRYVVVRFLKKRPLPIISSINGNKVQLYNHQIKALEYMHHREQLSKEESHGIRGGIIKMTMGLGKTLLAISHSLTSFRPRRPEKFGHHGFPTLVITTKTVMTEWKTEGFEKFFPNVKVLYLHNNYIDNPDDIIRKNIVRYEFVVTTYDICCNTYRVLYNHKTRAPVENRPRQQSDNPNASGFDIIYNTPWERVICDESQRFANYKTVTFRSMMSVYGYSKWCLTGTPIKNYNTDLWSQLRFCGYDGIDYASDWNKRGVDAMSYHNLTSAILSIDYDSTNIELPSKFEHDIYVTFSPQERECYNIVQSIARDNYTKILDHKIEYSNILPLITRLRQCAIAPCLLSNMSGKFTRQSQKKWFNDLSGTSGMRSAKMLKIIELLKSFPDHEKVLIFTFFKSVSNLIAKTCRELLPSFNFVQLDGNTKIKDRNALVNKFKTQKTCRGLFTTYKVGSEGLNLTVATRVICVEPWWNDATSEQAKTRCYRTGQTQTVHVYNIYTKNSIEERAATICKNKKQMAVEFLGSRFNKAIIGKLLDVS
jgi:SNF2 family DNA or RNA helicase